MASWKSFQTRWNQLQSADIGKNAVDISELAGELSGLQQFLVYVTAKAILEQPLTLEDKTLRSFLGIEGEDDPRRALVQMIAQIQHRHDPQAVKIVKCPGCGAGVRDLVGIHDERCNFCGVVLRTER